MHKDDEEWIFVDICQYFSSGHAATLCNYALLLRQRPQVSQGALRQNNLRVCRMILSRNPTDGVHGQDIGHGHCRFLCLESRG
jgi:hypothetical protein